MIGFSIYPDDQRDLYKVFLKMKEIGFKSIFTSSHIPEINDKKRLFEIIDLSRKFNMDIVLDVDNNSIIDFLDDQFKDLIFRMDYGISYKDMANFSKDRKISLNASTIRENDLLELKKYKANFKNIVAIHNFYPRVDTGLSHSYFRKQNEILRKYKIKIGAFSSGDKCFRKPMFKGLVTIEDFRYKNTFVQVLIFLLKEEMDYVFISDPDFYDYDLFKIFKEGLIPIPIKVFDQDKLISSYTFKNRRDHAKNVIRCEGSRSLFNNVNPFNTVYRKKGSITMDNYLNKRYEGELQIILSDLKAQNQINVVAEVEDKYLDLLDLIVDERSFKFYERDRKKKYK